MVVEDVFHQQNCSDLTCFQRIGFRTRQDPLNQLDHVVVVVVAVAVAVAVVVVVAVAVAVAVAVVVVVAVAVAVAVVVVVVVVVEEEEEPLIFAHRIHRLQLVFHPRNPGRLRRDA